MRFIGAPFLFRTCCREGKLERKPWFHICQCTDQQHCRAHFWGTGTKGYVYLIPDIPPVL